MKVILLQDIRNVGKKYDVKEVADGYVRNMLLPKGLVKFADKDALKELELLKKHDEKHDAELMKKLAEFAGAIDGKQIEFPVKTDDKGAVFGSVTKEMVLKALREHDFPHETRVEIELEHPIKKLGSFPVPVRFQKGIEAKILVTLRKQE